MKNILREIKYQALWKKLNTELDENNENFRLPFVNTIFYLLCSKILKSCQYFLQFLSFWY